MTLTVEDISAEKEKTRRTVQGVKNGAPGSKRVPLRYFRKKDGAIFPGEICTGTFISGGRKKIIGAVRDITEHKRGEEKLFAYQEQLRSLASDLSFTEERERRRLATDLHDSVGQILAISKIKLDALRSAAPLSPVAGDLDEVRELVGEAIEQTRSLTFDLSPPVLYELGLGAALESFVDNIQKLHGIQVHFTDDNQPKPLSEDIRVLLFRAVQELLVNSIKHAGAQNARISTQRDGNRIRIRVEDDGIGFDVSEIESHENKVAKFGLFSIRERLHHLGGRFEIVSKPGQGTQATLVASLEGEERPVKGKAT